MFRAATKLFITVRVTFFSDNHTRVQNLQRKLYCVLLTWLQKLFKLLRLLIFSFCKMSVSTFSAKLVYTRFREHFCNSVCIFCKMLQFYIAEIITFVSVSRQIFELIFNPLCEFKTSKGMFFFASIRH